MVDGLVPRLFRSELESFMTVFPDFPKSNMYLERYSFFMIVRMHKNVTKIHKNRQNYGNTKRKTFTNTEHRKLKENTNNEL